MATTTFPLDAYTAGARFQNVTASVAPDGERLRLSGRYGAPGGLVPVLLFSMGVQWTEQSALYAQDGGCCLWEMARRYENAELAAALGPTCVKNVTGMDLLKGNQATSDGTWTVDTRAHPSFVAMLFVAESTLYHQVLPLQWTQAGSACFNAKPDNAVFVFSANWFTTFQCKWVCRTGFAGPGCEVEVNLAVYVTGTLIAALCVAGMLVCMLEETRRVSPVPK